MQITNLSSLSLAEQYKKLRKECVAFESIVYCPLENKILTQHPSYSFSDIARTIRISYPELSAKMANCEAKLENLSKKLLEQSPNATLY